MSWTELRFYYVWQHMWYPPHMFPLSNPIYVDTQIFQNMCSLFRCTLYWTMKYTYRLPMSKSQQSWIQSLHPQTQWNLSGGRWSSVEQSSVKNPKNLPFWSYIVAEMKRSIFKKCFVIHQNDKVNCFYWLSFKSYWDFSSSKTKRRVPRNIGSFLSLKKLD